jgi:hypothetical protein
MQIHALDCYIPFFTSADPNNIRNKNESKPLELFIDNPFVDV